MAAKGSDVIWVRLRSKTPPYQWFVHPDLLGRMVADAEERGTNLTDLALQILCSHFKVPYTPVLRRSKPTADKDVLNFGAPAALTRALAATYPRKEMDGVRRILCAHYGLGIPVKVKQRRTRRPRAAAA